MPLVIDDGGGGKLGPNFGNSKMYLDRILAKYPEYINELHADIHTIVPLERPTNVERIYCYQFNKVRIKLAQIKRKHGFPVRSFFTVAFFNYIMFGIPFYTKMHIKESINSWSQVGMRWRGVRIGDLPVEDTVQGQLYIVGRSLAGIVGLSGMFDDILKASTIRNYPIYENIIMYSGLHNIVIISNWDKILTELNKEGF